MGSIEFTGHTRLSVVSRYVKILVLGAISASSLGCGGDPDQPEPVVTNMFQQDAILDIHMSFSDSDWFALRRETNIGRVNGTFGPVDPCFEYSEFYGSLSINGNVFDNVNITKKGTFGSVDSNRPSLKINLGKGEGNDGRQLYGEKRFTLNNNKQDPAIIKQCLAYHLFNLAGIHSPLCNFAKVTVQDEDLGIYTHVEAIKKPFLERTFGNKSGNLYEVQRDGAFIESRIEYIAAKTNEDKIDRAELYAVVNAMAASDDQLWSEMAKVINMDYFITFAVMEALMGHTDGFTSYQNNAYFYLNPDDNLLYFIPWGTDQAFRKQYIVISNDDTPASVFLGSSLMQRLWQLPEFRAAYDLRLLHILDTIWNEAELVVTADRLAGIVDAHPSEVEKIHEFILGRRALVEAELDGLADRKGKWVELPPVEEPQAACVAAE